MVRHTRFTATAVALALGLTSLGACVNPPTNPPGTTTTTGAPTSTSPSTVPSTTTPTTTPTTPTTRPPAGARVDNPYVGARPYLDSQWQARVRAAADRHPQLAAQMRAVANQPTAVWMDRIAAIDPPNGMSLREHLDAAVTQAGTGSQPLLFTVVIYNLPTRDCAALASNGELKIEENGLARYRSEYIDPIAEILGDAKYSNLRIVAVIEPDSLPNLITNTSDGTSPANAKPACDLAKSSGAYVQGVQYALDALHPIGNVYSYVDIAHSGWLGWESNLGPAAKLIADTVKGTRAGANAVAGFVSNTANYTPTTEPHIPFGKQINGQDVRQASFYEWNPYFDELNFAQAMRRQFIANGLPESIGMLIDTSRNGWGGQGRPGAASTSTDINTFVNESKTDRRVHRGNWCNQNGAGIGERPRANPAPGLDAYVWVKPPGESDGSSRVIPNDEGKGFDRMCDPTYGGNSLNGNNPTNAKADAPVAGQWFDEQFRELVANAYPAL
jgi:cellulose 1,4-beta-cellobiosidase